jgi:hypothetical protein
MKKVFFGLVLLTVALPSQGRIITVDDDGPADFNDIQSAIDDASNGDVVVVNPGMYTGPGNDDIRFMGKAITVQSIDPNDPAIVAGTVIDCGGMSRPGITFRYGEGPGSFLAGLTVTNCHARRFATVYCNGSSPTIANCMFRDNSGAESGGIYCSTNASPTIVNCIFSENHATRGGAIRSRNSSPSLIGCIFTRNSALGSGGAVDNSERSSVNMTNCVFAGNSGGQYGGGIYDYGSDANLVNCTFSGNFAQDGNAVSNNSYAGHPSSVQMTNCVLWDGGNEIYDDGGSTVTITYSDIQGGYVGEGNIDADPCFAFFGDYHLLAGSLCIDAGTNTPLGGLPTTDIDGNPRPLDGDGDGNSIADMGAYEYNPNSPSIAVSAWYSSYIEGFTSPSQTLLIRNSGAGTLHWQIREDCNWLEVSPAAGVSSGQTDQVVVTVDGSSLSPGHYRTALQIVDHNAANNPVPVFVSLYVGHTLDVPADYNTIQAAIDAAEDYDSVVIAAGRYTGDGNRDLDFKGKPIAVRSTDPADPNLVAATIIDCNGTNDDPHRGFHFHNDEDANSIVGGLTITNGYAPWYETCLPEWPYWPPCWVEGYPGGGIYCEPTSGWYEPGPGPTIRNCIVTGNTTIGDGAGGGIFGCSGPIVNCAITDNSAPYGGGLAVCSILAPSEGETLERVC